MSKAKTPSKTVKKPVSKPKTKPAAKSKSAAAKPASSGKSKAKPKPASKTKPKPPAKPKAAKAVSKSAPKAKAEESPKVKPEPKPKTPKMKEFVVDQKVVYPSQGVGVIQEITQKKFKDVKVPYYKIYIEVTDMTIWLPVEKAAELGIRPTVSREEANKALELIKEDFDPIPTDWKLRYQMNLDLLKKGSIRDIASIVRSLYHRSKVKELPIQERKLYDSALKLLIDETSISLRKSKEEIEELIFSRLEIE